jgi:hypothetical protein
MRGTQGFRHTSNALEQLLHLLGLALSERDPNRKARIAAQIRLLPAPAFLFREAA